MDTRRKGYFLWGAEWSPVLELPINSQNEALKWLLSSSPVYTLNCSERVSALCQDPQLVSGRAGTQRQKNSRARVIIANFLEIFFHKERKSVLLHKYLPRSVCAITIQICGSRCLGGGESAHVLKFIACASTSAVSLCLALAPLICHRPCQLLSFLGVVLTPVFYILPGRIFASTLQLWQWFEWKCVPVCACLCWGGNV